jgi:hypothetical protein
MSAFVKKTPAIGVLRGESGRGCNCGMLSICRGRSGEALIKNQCCKPSESLLIAMLDCVCGAIFPIRAATQLVHAQFHWGKPPPAALPRIWIRINPSFRSRYPVRSNCTRVTGALEKDRHGLQHRFDPPLFGPSHESHGSDRSAEPFWSNYFLIKLMSPLRSTRASRIVERSSVCALRRMSSSRSCVERWFRRIVRKSH